MVNARVACAMSMVLPLFEPQLNVSFPFASFVASPVPYQTTVIRCGPCSTPSSTYLPLSCESAVTSEPFTDCAVTCAPAQGEPCRSSTTPSTFLTVLGTAGSLQIVSAPSLLPVAIIRL